MANIILYTTVKILQD